MESGPRGLTITALNAAARREGLHPGLGLADARARIPDLVSEPAVPERDAEALLALAHWCGRYSPALNVDGIDGLWIDATGVAHLFGGEAGMLEDIRTRFGALGIRVRTGLADTLAAAWALARFDKTYPSRECDFEARLFAVPVEGLRLSPDTVTLLKRLGLYRIGQLAKLPRANLQSRFRSRKAVDAVLLRLDQALGVRSEPRAPLIPPTIYAVRLAFPEPLISSEAFEGTLRQLVDNLCTKLAEDLRGAREILFTAYRCDGTAARVEAGLSAPSRTPAHFMRLLMEKVVTIDAGFGIDCLTLSATVTERLGAGQESLADGAGAVSPEPLIDRLANRLAAARVVRTAPCESYIPERAERHVPALNAEASVDAITETGITAARPSLLFVPPELIDVMAEIPEGPPARFKWRRIMHRILKAEGPERITPEWWREIGDKASRPRDYYRVEDDAGRRYWIFRDGLYDGQGEDEMPKWYLHGVFG